MATRTCTACAEVVQAAAVKCKHCGATLVPLGTSGSASALRKAGAVVVAGALGLSGAWIFGREFSTAPQPERNMTEPATAASAPPASLAASSTVSSLALATFKGEDMTRCASLRLTTSPSTNSANRWLPDEKIAIGLVDDLALAAAGGDAEVVTEGPEALRIYLDSEAAVRWFVAKATKEKDKRSDEAMLAAAEKALLRIAEALVWPTKTFAGDVKKGVVAKVETCDFEGRTVLATCSLRDETSSASWSWEQRHYSVAEVIDSDAAFRRCTTMHGSWQAAPRDDRAIVAERLRQHATRAGDQLGKAQEQMQRSVKAMRALQGDE